MRNQNQKRLDQNQNPKNLGNRRNQRKMMTVVLRVVVIKNLNVVQDRVQQKIFFFSGFIYLFEFHAAARCRK